MGRAEKRKQLSVTSTKKEWPDSPVVLFGLGRGYVSES